MELNYNQLLLISMWQYNHYEYEGLTLKLFQETFGNEAITTTNGYIISTITYGT